LSDELREYVITARYPDTCSRCKGAIPKDTKIVYTGAKRPVWHFECPKPQSNGTVSAAKPQRVAAFDPFRPIRPGSVLDRMGAGGKRLREKALARRLGKASEPGFPAKRVQRAEAA